MITINRNNCNTDDDDVDDNNDDINHDIDE